MPNKIPDTIKEMKSLSELLIPYTYPKADFSVEQDVLILKQRVLDIDGYEVTVCYSIADYDDYFLESLQMQSTTSPMLPFFMVCKIGKLFLGSENLSFIDFIKGNKKIYCWTIKKNDNIVLPPDSKAIASVYDGFEFFKLNPSSIDLH